MINETISAINSVLSFQLGAGNHQVLGIAKAVNDQQEKGVRLVYGSAELKRLTIDDSYDWQSAHVIGRLIRNADTSDTFGTISYNQYDLGITLIVASKRADLLDFITDSFSLVSHLQVDNIATDTVEVLRRNWLIPVDQAKNYDPALSAIALSYRILNAKTVTGTLVNYE